MSHKIILLAFIIIAFQFAFIHCRMKSQEDASKIGRMPLRSIDTPECNPKPSCTNDK